MLGNQSYDRRILGTTKGHSEVTRKGSEKYEEDWSSHGI